MAFDPKLHHRRSIRLPEWDYTSEGAYFMTLCVHNKQCIFGEVISGIVQLSKFGVIAQEQWMRAEVVRNNVELDAFVVMPNHVHGIIFLRDPGISVGATRWVARSKNRRSARTRATQGTPGTILWQRNYYEHVIRNEKEWMGIRQYIFDNPIEWDLDPQNPHGRWRKPKEKWQV